MFWKSLFKWLVCEITIFSFDGFLNMTQIIQRNAHSLKNLINPLLKSSLNIGKLANKLIEWRRPWGPYGQTNWHPYKSLSSTQNNCTAYYKVKMWGLLFIFWKLHHHVKILGSSTYWKVVEMRKTWKGNEFVTIKYLKMYEIFCRHTHTD